MISNRLLALVILGGAVVGPVVASGPVEVTLGQAPTGISGRLVREGTTSPLVQRIVRVWRTTGAFVDGTMTDASGVYAFGSLGPGSYIISTLSHPTWDTGLLDELYGDHPCPGGFPSGCSAAAGTPILVVSGEMTTGIDLELGAGGRIAGRIFDIESALPVAGVLVSAYNGNSGLVATATSDAAGRYVIAGLAGVTRLVATGSSDHLPQVWEGVPCGPVCDPSLGTPIVVEVGETVAGVDFLLERRGAIAGRVVHAGSGEPLRSIQVTAVGGFGESRSTTTNALGEYVIGGLDVGSYSVTARDYYGEHIAEVWPNVPCSYVCDPSAGDPVLVQTGETTAPVDFALDRLGSIAGTAIDAQNGQPALGTVWIFDAGGVLRRTAGVTAGNYQAAALLPGTYKVVFQSEDHRGMLYDGIDCPTAPSGCSLALGSEVVVAAESVTSGVDFEVEPHGKLAGTVLPESGSEPILGYTVRVWNLSGALVRSDTFYAPAWEVRGVPVGSYVVSVTHPDFLAELYDDVPCQGGEPAACDPGGQASVVAVAAGVTTSGLDFDLQPMGSITGVLTRASDGAAVGGDVQVFDGSGSLVATRFSAEVGGYRVGGLPTGEYYVKAKSSDLSARLYDGVACPHLCDVTQGTPVAVALGAVTAGIDIALPARGEISGVVSAAAGALPNQTWLHVSGSDGEPYDSLWLGTGGAYSLMVEQGTYYVAAYSGEEFVPQLYDGIKCPSAWCSPTDGTPIVVEPGSSTPGIDFALEPQTGIVGKVVDSRGLPLSGVAIDLWSASGTWLAAGASGPNGRYRLPQTSGSFFVTTDNRMGAIDEVWATIHCPLGPAYLGLCDPTQGDPVSPAGNLAAGVDFVLEGVPIFVDGFESGDTSGWQASFEGINPWGAR